MLADAEQPGARKLLTQLAFDDLSDLAKTVLKAKKDIQILTGADVIKAIDAIVDESESAEELLKRIKITNDDLEAYLKDEGFINKRRSFEARNKADLVKETLKHWRTSEPPKQNKETQTTSYQTEPTKVEKESQTTSYQTEPTKVEPPEQHQGPSSAGSSAADSKEDIDLRLRALERRVQRLELLQEDGQMDQAHHG